MKTHPRLLLAGAAALALGACATYGLRHGGGVNFHESFVEIHPGTKIEPEDQRKLDDALGRFKRKLYKIKRYDKGNVVATQGRLRDVLIEQTLLAEVAKAVSDGVSYSALQIGSQGHPDHSSHPNHTNHPNRTSHPDHSAHPNLTHTEYLECVEMVKQVTPILNKYHHD